MTGTIQKFSKLVALLHFGALVHHIYGISYIPASAIKGIARHFYMTEKFGFTETTEQQALQQQEFCDMFSCYKKSYYKQSKERRSNYFF